MFTPIEFSAVQEVVSRLSGRLQMQGFVVVVYLLSAAFRKDGIYKGVEIGRGDVVVNSRKIPENIPVTRQEYRSTQAALEKAGFLTHKLTQPFTIISICNFDDYVIDFQKTNPETNPQLTQESEKTNPPIMNIKSKSIIKEKNKNLKGGKKETKVSVDLSKLQESEHWDFISWVTGWFYGPDVSASPDWEDLSPSEQVKAMNAVKLILTKDMGNEFDCEERLLTILRWATEDSYWAQNVQAIPPLHLKSNGQYKWRNLEIRMQSKQKSAPAQKKEADPDAEFEKAWNRRNGNGN